MPKKVLFIIDSFAGGGAERVLSRVMNGIDRHNFKPSLYLLLRAEQAYPLADDIPVDFQPPRPVTKPVQFLISLLALLVSLPRICRPKLFRETYGHLCSVMSEIAMTSCSLREKLRTEQPDAIVVFLQSSIFITLLTVLFFRISIPVCCSDRVFLSRELHNLRHPKVMAFLLRLLYRRADRYIAVTEEIRRDMTVRFGLSTEKIVTIHNGVDLALLRSLAAEPGADDQLAAHRSGAITIITSGRLMPQKGHHLLLSAFALVRQKVDCSLMLLGDGALLGELKQLASDLGIANNVVFAGWQQNPFNCIASADIFVLSSHYEGFPNSLLEAMALGLPIVATDCQSGPAEILDNGRYGLLVPVDDVESLASALTTLALDAGMRQEFSRLSRERAEFFSHDRMVTGFETMLIDLLPGASL